MDCKLLRKSMDWFLYDNGFRHERVKRPWNFETHDSAYSNIGAWGQMMKPVGLYASPSLKFCLPTSI